ncbi:MAG TPA: ATP-binding cassette domain-containing protein, partial [Deinococcales bacterium]|nr:ATP-binding cassette domain-containing protein [Deinococcales bacterium]
GLTGLLRSVSDHSIFTFALVQLGFASAERILSLINAETDAAENHGGHAAQLDGQISFQDVGFTWPGARTPALEHVSFTVEPGETVALVGQTGSGKTTLTKLVNRTFSASSGRVLIDGVDVQDWNLEVLRPQVSLIEQEVFLFSRSIAANIAFGLPGASREQVVTAAKAARAHDFIMEFPDGYDTVIGERGATLSGGQRQRLAIARALLTNPRILVLDDATSAIDSATEDEIQQALRAVMKGRTSLVITHRLSQIRQADRILLFGDRTVLDEGTHGELLSRSEPYRRIFRRYD